VALAVAGCGSSQLSASDLRTNAMRLCATANQATGRIPSPKSPAGAGTFLKQGIAVMRPELASLEALSPPSDLAQVYGISTHAFAGKLHALDAAVRRLDRGADPVPAVQSLQRRLAPLESEENGAWQALQIPACLNR
jgi:hypothetical protein